MATQNTQPNRAYSATPRATLKALPLCVDLDGTLIQTDLLYETLADSLRRNFWIAFCLPLWLLRGKAHFKKQLAMRSTCEAALLPYNPELLSYLQNEHRGNRKLVLATASHESLAKSVSDHLGLFDEVMASDGTLNLSGTRKQEALDARFGRGGYVYAGNSAADLAVWKSAPAVLVGVSNRMHKRVRSQVPVEAVFPGASFSSRRFFKAIRVYQWVKNILIFVPLVASHTLFQKSRLGPALSMFVSFSLAASSLYLLNDLLDLQSDRHHPEKKSRPFAAGELSIPLGFTTAIIFLLISSILAIHLSTASFGILLTYFLGGMLYSFWLKRVALLDVFVLAGLYTLRVIAGHISAHVLFSAWLLAFVLFFFISLAFAKRYSELYQNRIYGTATGKGRGYETGDLELVSVFGVASGFISVLVMTLYVTSSAVQQLYASPIILWLLGPLLLYWLCRMWLIAHRGQLNEDSIVFALRDPSSYGVLAVALVVIFTAMHPIPGLSGWVMGLFHNTVSALCYTLASDMDDSRHAMEHPPCNDVVRFVLSQHEKMSRPLKDLLAIATVGFGLMGLVYGGLPFHRLSLERRSLMVAAARIHFLPPLRDLVLFYDSLVTLALYSGSCDSAPTL